MTTTEDVTPGAPAAGVKPIIQLKNIGKTYGHVLALQGISLQVGPGEVTCVLGDNGAGKSTLIKIISGRHQPSEGELLVDGSPVQFSSPRDSLDRGISTVYQDLAVVPLMPVWRNFFLGSEETAGFWPFRRLKVEEMRTTAQQEMRRLGIELPDIEAPIASLSGGQRQVVAIARAIHFGARVLILDEPTAALGVKQSGMVLRYVSQAAKSGIGVVLITHNPHHAYMVGDHFVILKLGRMDMDSKRSETSRNELIQRMAGGEELETLQHELQA